MHDYSGDPALVSNSLAAVVLDATNAVPIEVQTVAAHGYGDNDTVVVSGVTGNTAANGTWKITLVAADKFSLDGSTGNGAYAGGGDTVDVSLTPQIPIVDDGDPRNAASVDGAFEKLADRVQFVALLAHTIEDVFTAEGVKTWTCPPEVFRIGVERAGGGGGGGGGAGGLTNTDEEVTPGGGGGGAAPILFTEYETVPGTVYTVTIPAAAAAGAGGISDASGADGSDGGDVHFTAGAVDAIGKGGQGGKGGVGSASTGITVFTPGGSALRASPQPFPFVTGILANLSRVDPSSGIGGGGASGGSPGEPSASQTGSTGLDSIYGGGASGAKGTDAGAGITRGGAGGGGGAGGWGGNGAPGGNGGNASFGAAGSDGVAGSAGTGGSGGGGGGAGGCGGTGGGGAGGVGGSGGTGGRGFVRVLYAGGKRAVIA